MHNARYPTAAEAVDMGQFRGSKLVFSDLWIFFSEILVSPKKLLAFRITLLPSKTASFESLEIFRLNSKDQSSRNSEFKRRTTEFSQFQSIQDLTRNPSSKKLR